MSADKKSKISQKNQTVFTAGAYPVAPAARSRSFILPHRPTGDLAQSLPNPEAVRRGSLPGTPIFAMTNERNPSFIHTHKDSLSTSWTGLNTSAGSLPSTTSTPSAFVAEMYKEKVSTCLHKGGHPVSCEQTDTVLQVLEKIREGGQNGALVHTHTRCIGYVTLHDVVCFLLQLPSVSKLSEEFFAAKISSVLGIIKKHEYAMLNENEPVFDAVTVLGDRKINVLLIHNEDNHVIGALTRRDVLTHFRAQHFGSRDTVAVKDMFECDLTKQPAVWEESSLVLSVLKSCVENHKLCAPIVNSHNIPLYSLPTSIIKFLSPETANLLFGTVEDLNAGLKKNCGCMLPKAPVIREGTMFRKAISILLSTGANQLQITDSSGRIIALLQDHDVMREFLLC